MSTSTMTFEEEVKELARGDTDSLVVFYNELCELSNQHGTVKVLRAEPAVELIIGAESATTLRYSGHIDRLTKDEVRRYVENRDGDNIVNRLVYDLLDDAWRVANGQEIEGEVEVKLA